MIDPAVSSRGKVRQQTAGLKLEEIAIIVLFLTVTLDNLNLTGHASMTGTDITPAKLATLVALGFWIGRGLLTKDPRLFSTIFNNPTSFFIGAFIAISMLSIINVTYQQPVPGAPSPWVLVARRVSYFLLYCVVISVVRNRKVLEYALLALVIGGIATCLAGTYEMITGEQFLKAIPTGREVLVTTKIGAVRVQGLESDADVQATFLVFGLAFLLYFFYRSASWQKMGFFILVILYVANIIATGARGAWVGLGLILLLYFLLLNDPRKWKVFGISCLLALVVFVALTLNPNTITLEKLKLGVSPATQQRVGWILMGWEMVKDHPFLGIGTAGFPNSWYRYFPVASSMLPNRPLDCVNGYMKVWAENGTIGLLIFLLLLFSVLFEVWSVSRRIPQADGKTLGIAVLIAYAAILWTLAVFPVLDGKYMWLSIGLCIAYSNIFRQGTTEKKSTSEEIHRWEN